MLSFVTWAGSGAGLLSAGFWIWEGAGWRSNLVRAAGFFWVMGYLGWVGDIRGCRRLYGRVRSCCMSGDDINPGGIRQVWLGGLFFRCSHFSYRTPMSETLIGSRNLCVVTNLFCRLDWVNCWSTTNTPVFRTLSDKCCCKLTYWALGRWLMFSIWTPENWKQQAGRVSRRLACHNRRRLQLGSKDCRGKMVKHPAVITWIFRRLLGGYGLMYQKAQARQVLKCCGNRFGNAKSVYTCMVCCCWKFLAQANCGHNPSNLVRLYVFWVKAKYCSRSLITGIISICRTMVQIVAIVLMKDQMQNGFRAGGLRSTTSLRLKSCCRILLVTKSRPVFIHVSRGVIRMLQVPEWIIKECNQDVKKGTWARNGKHIGHITWGWGLGRVQILAWIIYQLFGEIHYGLNTMRHMLLKRKRAHRKNSNFCGPHIYFDTHWNDSVSGYTSCKFGLRSPCKARFLFIPSLGSMISYFWSPKHVLDDVTGGMPPG
ncbi:hypothetical protein Hanom_Chr01g00000561 [Helianthus anomalus]